MTLRVPRANYHVLAVCVCVCVCVDGCGWVWVGVCMDGCGWVCGGGGNGTSWISMFEYYVLGIEYTCRYTLYVHTYCNLLLMASPEELIYGLCRHSGPK